MNELAEQGWKKKGEAGPEELLRGRGLTRRVG